MQRWTVKCDLYGKQIFCVLSFFFFFFFQYLAHGAFTHPALYTTPRAKQWVGAVARAREESREGCFPIVGAGICGWRVMLADVFVELIFLDS